MANAEVTWPAVRMPAARYAPPFITCIVLTVVALLVRGRWIGNPLPQVDEQFYLLVADRMWHGALPYVDIWDRKPIGLFLLYALLRPLSADGIVAYQTGAFVFAVATAFTLVRICTRIGTLPAATIAGVLYLIYLPIVGGNGGQSPVFYNLFMALAALAIIKADEIDPRRSILPHGLLAMSLVGFAIQIKYTAVAEGIGFGLYLIVLQWRRDRRIAALIRFVSILAAVALLPTVMAIAYFACRGFGPTFLYANFLSIFHAKEPSGVSNLGNLLKTMLKMAPIMLPAILGLVIAFRRRPLEPIILFMALWELFAVIGFAMIGRFYDHYALPMLLPLCILLTPVLENILAVGVVIGLSSGIMLLATSTQTFVARQQYIAQLVEVLTPYAHRGCLFIKDGPPIVYLLTHSCLPTRFVFPEHLSTVLEARATNASLEMEKLIASRPSAIVISDRKPEHPPNLETLTTLNRALRSDYSASAKIPEVNGTDHQTVYVRNDLR